MNLSQILGPLLKSLTHTPVPLRVKAAPPLPHELKGLQHLCSAPLLSCPIRSLSGLLPGHTGYVASPPTLQNLPANLARGPAPLSALTALPSPATEVTQQPSSQECPSYNGDPPLGQGVSDPSSAYSSLLPTSHHLNSLAYYLMPVLVLSPN